MEQTLTANRFFANAYDNHSDDNPKGENAKTMTTEGASSRNVTTTLQPTKHTPQITSEQPEHHIVATLEGVNSDDCGAEIPIDLSDNYDLEEGEIPLEKTTPQLLEAIEIIGQWKS
ncbi:hypothetical protein Tco_1400812 [Tanacetum coccineum]